MFRNNQNMWETHEWQVQQQSYSVKFTQRTDSVSVWLGVSAGPVAATSGCVPSIRRLERMYARHFASLGCHARFSRVSKLLNRRLEVAASCRRAPMSLQCNAMQ